MLGVVAEKRLRARRLLLAEPREHHALLLSIDRVLRECVEIESEPAVAGVTHEDVLSVDDQ